MRVNKKNKNTREGERDLFRAKQESGAGEGNCFVVCDAEIKDHLFGGPGKSPRKPSRGGLHVWVPGWLIGVELLSEAISHHTACHALTDSSLRELTRLPTWTRLLGLGHSPYQILDDSFCWLPPNSPRAKTSPLYALLSSQPVDCRRPQANFFNNNVS